MSRETLFDDCLKLSRLRGNGRVSRGFASLSATRSNCVLWILRRCCLRIIRPV